jgi:hypothetical protein
MKGLTSLDVSIANPHCHHLSPNFATSLLGCETIGIPNAADADFSKTAVDDNTTDRTNRLRELNEVYFYIQNLSY